MSIWRRYGVLSLAVLVISVVIGWPGLGAQGGGRGGGGAQDLGAGQRGGRAQAQGPARDAANQQQVPAGTAVISGTVSLAGTGSPVRRAQVTLSGNGRGGRSSATDDEGRFAFVGLPAGRFTLSASKPGFSTISYGAKKPGRQGTPIQLAEGQILANVNLTLPKGSVLTGVVVDEYGEPSPNTQVRAYRAAFINGERTLQSAGQSQTDDRGIYRIFQLQPGDYIVSAIPRDNRMNALSVQIQGQIQPLIDQVQAAGGVNAVVGGAFAGGGFAEVFAGRGQEILAQIQQFQQQPQQATGYAPVYYPGTTTPAQASKIALSAGEERSGVDFQLQLVPTAKVQGRVMGADPAATPGMQVMLQPARQQDVASVPGLGTSMSRINPDGTFTFQSVAPGDYRLMARAPIRQVEPAQAPDNVAAGGRVGRGRGGPGQITQVLWASTDVSVNGQDVSDVTLTLQPGLTISGRLAFDSGSAQPPADLASARVNLSPVDGQQPMGPQPAQQVDANGNFTLTGIVPGRYSLRANIGGGGRAAGAGGGFVDAAGAAPTTQSTPIWTMKSAMVNGRDALDFPLDIEPDQSLSGIVLTFTDRVQELSGTLQDALGRPTPDYTIILFPADNRFWVSQSRRILSTRPSTAGTFTLRGFPPGQYRLAAVVDAEPGEWYDPNFLTQLVPASMMLTVNEGEKKTQDIRLATAQ